MRISLPETTQRAAVCLELVLWLGGLAGAAYLCRATAQVIEAGSSVIAANSSVDGARNSIPILEGAPPRPRSWGGTGPARLDGAQPPNLVTAESTRTSGDVIGELTIPRLGLAVPVMSDFEPDSLLRGVGHIQGTALPGGLGTMGLAGHRDTYFRPLQRTAPGMIILVTDRSGTYRYVIDTTEIVAPEAVRVLDIQDRPALTLVTCYPFDFIGAAPKRFIVHAHLTSVLPDITVQ